MRSLGPILLAFGALGLSDAAPGQVEQQAVQQRRQTEAEKPLLRERLRQQFNLILETRETTRGLIVDLGDALFDPGKSSLKPGAREKLAKVAGILLAYPGLKVRLEGRTDAVGTRERDADLAGQRAGAVRDYLSAQGVSPASMTATGGLGAPGPAVSGAEAAVRERSCHVEMVVSGGRIGIEGAAPSATASSAPVR